MVETHPTYGNSRSASFRALRLPSGVQPPWPMAPFYARAAKPDRRVPAFGRSRRLPLLVESARRFDDGGIDSGYSAVGVDGESRLLHSLPVGAIVFAAPESAGEPGALYMLEEPYSPVDSTIPMTLMAVRLLRDSRQCVTRTCDPAALPFLIDSTQSYRGRGKDRASQPFALDVRKLFIATPYTSELEIPRSKTKGWERTKRYFHFDSTPARRPVGGRHAGGGAAADAQGPADAQAGDHPAYGMGGHLQAPSRPDPLGKYLLRRHRRGQPTGAARLRISPTRRSTRALRGCGKSSRG